MPTGETAIRKRQQIANANRMMFLWVAAASVIIGIAAVVSLFLVQKLLFNEKVLAEKTKTASVLSENNKAVNELKNQVRVLNTNQALKDSMVPGENEPIQVVLDALPDKANSSALGASLQEKFLNDPALKLESLNVDPVAGVESLTDSNVQDASVGSSAGANQITFRFAVSTEVANANVLKDLLQKLERSVRTIDITGLTVETQGARLVLTVNGHAFYEPAKSVDLKDKTVKP